MNIIGKPDVYEMPLTKWYERNLQPLIDGTPEDGELRINWYPEAFEEKAGEFVTIEKWNGLGWEQYGLDVDDTVQDLLDLDWKLGGSHEY